MVTSAKRTTSVSQKAAMSPPGRGMVCAARWRSNVKMYFPPGLACSRARNLGAARGNGSRSTAAQPGGHESPCILAPARARASERPMMSMSTSENSETLCRSSAHLCRALEPRALAASHVDRAGARRRSLWTAAKTRERHLPSTRSGEKSLSGFQVSLSHLSLSLSLGTRAAEAGRWRR